ncbi:DNA double-strand break repair rad50 ATPase, putative isoform 1 [Theobroma cacao]|uniref:DNA double-strand break repair rad50 ATPase, putative isoform 1 n=1 Tax=Theobroma cacao TaxID=3641 RepID=A0A061EYI5_THECC|nr:DNA double-strand break repair rad50 ATPase, putative isoform 1 [Theobroma cacao]
MGKQGRSKAKPENLGKGKVTPVQVAFIVDRYLSDNNYPGTRSVFRNEASALISKSPVREAPKSLLSLGAMLDEYICLKEQKVMLEQEKARLEQEKCRVQTLLQGMQSVMNAYNASATASVPVIPHATATKSVAVVPQSDPCAGSPSGPPVYGTPTVIPVSGPSNSRMEHDNYSSPVTSQPITRKKRSSEAVTEAPAAEKKTRSKLTSRKLTTQGTEKLPESENVMNSQVAAQLIPANQSSPPNSTSNTSTMHVSSVAKCLFNRPHLSPPTNSSGPKTPPQAVSPQSDKSMTPLGVSSTANCSHNNTPQEITPTNCTIISTERVTVSPLKQMTCYTIERNRCISSCSPVRTSLKRLGKRDHVKGRLDFDGSDAAVNVDKPVTNETSTSESEIDADIFDLDLPSLDAFGANFSFSELLVDLDLGCEGIGYPCQPTLGPSADALSGSSHESGDGNLGAPQVMSEFSSTVTKVFSEKDMNAQGPDSVTSVKSITKCVKILSPAKGRRSSSEQQNCSSKN